MTGYVLDHLALTAGLAGSGAEHHRREISRLLHSAIEGGPTLAVPALCLAATAAVRPAITGHLAALISDAPSGAINVPALTRTPPWDAVHTTFPDKDWPTLHAIVHAIASGDPLLTTEPAAYADIPVDVLAL